MELERAGFALQSSCSRCCRRKSCGSSGAGGAGEQQDLLGLKEWESCKGGGVAVGGGSCSWRSRLEGGCGESGSCRRAAAVSGHQQLEHH